MSLNLHITNCSHNSETAIKLVMWLWGYWEGECLLWVLLWMMHKAEEHLSCLPTGITNCISLYCQ